MGREKVPVVPPTLIALNEVEGLIHFAPTIIGFPYNAGIAVQTTCGTKLIFCATVHLNGSRGNFDRFLSSASFNNSLRISDGIRQPTFLCHCFYIGSPVDLIICKNERMSSAGGNFNVVFIYLQISRITQKEH